jgi:hypothetical protein
MEDVFSLIQKQQSMMGEMHKDFMSLISEYMDSVGDSDAFAEELAAPKKKRKSVEEIDEDGDDLSFEDLDSDYLLTNGIPREISEECEGVEYDDTGLPIIKSYSESEIDIDDPEFASGKYLGIPVLVSRDYTTRGSVNRLLPIRDLFEEL